MIAGEALLDESVRPTYRSAVEVRRGVGGEKDVRLPGGDQVTMGMSASLASVLGAPDPHRERSSALDYVVASAAASMAGTLARALAASGLYVPAADHEVNAVGEVFKREGVMVLERIRVKHSVRAPRAKWQLIELVHDVYQQGCDLSQSLAGAIVIESDLELR